MLRRITIGLCVATLLAGCGSSVDVAYKLTYNTSDGGKITDLSLAATRVVERRMENLGEEIKRLDISQETEGSVLSFSTQTEAAADLLTDQLTAPFSLAIMRAAKNKETPEVEVEGHGGFVQTGITEHHLEWVIAATEMNNKGRVTLQFTEEGRKLMRTVFKENVGQQIGLFVRKKLVAQLQVDTAELKDDIIITGLPSAELARVFADDVNVGLHVTFTPLP